MEITSSFCAAGGCSACGGCGTKAAPDGETALQQTASSEPILTVLHMERATHWTNGQVHAPTVITFAFGNDKTLTFDPGGLGTLGDGREFNDYQKNAWREAMRIHSEASGVQFIEATQAENANVVINYQTLSNYTGLGWVSYPGSSKQVRIEVNARYADQFDSMDFLLGEGDLPIFMLHEIGHSVGMKHPFEDEIRLPDSQNHRGVTMMSHSRNPDGTYIQDLTALDKAAVQYIFGTEADEKARPVQWSQLANGGLTSTGDAAGNAIVGIRDRDLIRGNGGDDTIAGGTGDDYLDGGTGTNSVRGDGGEDTLLIDTVRANDGNYTLKFWNDYQGPHSTSGVLIVGDRVDYFSGIEAFRFADGVAIASEAPALDTKALVAKMFKLALGRTATTEDLNYATSRIDAGTLTIFDYTSSLVTRPAWQRNYGSMSIENLTKELWQKAFRGADVPANMLDWATSVASPDTLLLTIATASGPQILDSAGDERNLKFELSPTASHVELAYRAIIGEIPDAETLGELVARVDFKGDSFEVVIADLLRSGITGGRAGVDLAEVMDTIKSNLAPIGTERIFPVASPVGDVSVVAAARFVAKALDIPILPPPTPAVEVLEVGESTYGFRIIDSSVVLSQRGSWDLNKVEHLSDSVRVTLNDGRQIDLPDVEQLQLLDGTIDFRSASAITFASRVYGALFRKEPPSALRDAWTAASENQSFGAMLSDIVGSSDFISKYGTLGSIGFPTAMYRTVLGREASASEIKDGVARLRAGESRSDFALSLLSSDDAISRFGSSSGDGVWIADGSAHWVAKMFDIAFNRAALTPDRDHHVQLLDLGVSLKQFADRIAFSQQTSTFSDHDFIKAMIRNALEREAKPEEISTWEASFASGTRRGDLLVSLLTSPEQSRQFAVLPSGIAPAGSGGDQSYLILGGTCDSLIGGTGAEELRTTGAIAFVDGGGGNDQIFGGARGETMSGGEGDDTLSGGDGDDTLSGGAGNDRMEGGLGNDAFFVDDVGDSVVETADQGVDTVWTTLAGYSLGAHIEHLTAVGGAARMLVGNVQNNAITGNAGSDTILSGDGDDTLNGAGGADSLVGGVGNDVYVVDSTGDVTSERGGGGVDHVLAGLSWTLGSNIERLTLTGSGNLFGTGNALNNRIEGNAGDNVLNGAAGNDTLIGGAGDDTLIGIPGNDSMVGGAGNDLYYVDGTLDRVVEAADGGIDRVIATVSYTLPANVENLTIGIGSGYSGIGNALGNTIVGNAAGNLIFGVDGDDVLFGMAGNDTLFGGTGSDRQFGGDGNDLLAGGVGNDVLVGGGGNDVLIGGSGADVFHLHSPTGGWDRINDFTTGVDRIELLKSGFGASLPIGQIADAAFSFGTAAIGGGPQILYDTTSGVLRWDQDGVGGSPSAVIAILTGAPDLAASDIQVVAVHGSASQDHAILF